MSPPGGIVFLSSGLGHVRRGIEIWMLELARHWPSSGNLELWTGGRDCGSTPARWVPLGSKSRETAAWKHLDWSTRYRREQYSTLWACLRRLPGLRGKVVYCGDPVLSVHLHRWSRLGGFRWVFMNGMRLSPKWASRFDGVHLLAPGYLEEAKRTLPSHLSSRFFAVPHFVDSTRFVPGDPSNRRRLRRNFGWAEDARIIGHLGPLGEHTGKRTAELAHEVATARPDLHLVVAGNREDGSNRVEAACREALGERFRFLDSLLHEEVPGFLGAVDLYALGSLAEPFSIALLEAMACGLPIVHHQDEVMDWQAGEGGLSVNFLQPGQPADAMRQLLADPDRLQRLARSARDLACSRYAPGPVARSIEQALLAIGQNQDPPSPTEDPQP